MMWDNAHGRWVSMCCAANSPAIPAPEEAAALLKRMHLHSSPAVVSDVLAAFDAGAAPSLLQCALWCP